MAHPRVRRVRDAIAAALTSTRSRRAWTGVITGVGLLAGMIAILVFVTGKNLPDFFSPSHPDSKSAPLASSSSGLELDTALVLVKNVKRVGENSYEILSNPDGPFDYGYIRVSYSVTNDGKPMSTKAVCSAVVTYKDSSFAETSRSASCSDTLPADDDGSSLLIVDQDNPHPVITVSVEYKGMKATKAIKPLIVDSPS
jgi:hypothetical protein